MLPPIEEYLNGNIKTLGWEVLRWCSDWLVNPDSYGGEKGAQWVFQPDQAHFVLAFYGVNDRGEWLYRRAYRERAKGSGKSPMVAAIACAEFLGPSKFDYFASNGQPVGRPHDDPMIWLAAVSLDGSDHTYKYVMGMLEGPAKDAYDLDIGMTRILVKGSKANKILKQVTASPKTLEGPKPTFVICEETQNWTPAEQGPALEAVIHRGLSKVNGRRIEVTNAPVPGQNSVAEGTHKYYQQILDGESQDDGLLFDTFSISVPDIYDKEQAMPALEQMYGFAPWMPPERVWRDINDPSHSEIDSRRFFFNELVAPNEMWLKAAEWDACESSRMQLHKRDKIAIGFRLRKNCCAIVATRLRDSALFVLKVWERENSPDTPRDWEVPYVEIDQYVRKLFRTHKVVYFMASPTGFADVIGRWAQDFEDEIVFEALWLDRNKQKHADAEDLFANAVRSGRLKHDGNEDLRRHIMQTFVTEMPQGKLLRMKTVYAKEYIVAAEAALLSFQGAYEAIEDKLDEDPPDNYVFSF